MRDRLDRRTRRDTSLPLPSRPLMSLFRPALAALLAASALAACRSDAGSGADTGGTVVISLGADADHLLPFLAASAQAAQVVDQLFLRLADMGDELDPVGDTGFEPRLAERWEWSADSSAVTFHLDPRARWHDGRRVLASDVQFTAELYADPAVQSPHASFVPMLDSVRALDSVRVTVWFADRSPERFFAVTEVLKPVPEHVYGEVPRDQFRAAPSVRTPVGNGPFRFVRWEPGTRLEIVADTTHFRGRPNLDRVIWAPAPDPATAVTRLFAGEADFYEALRQEHLAEVERNPNLRLVPHETFQYGYVQFNLRDPQNLTRPHPILGDRELRRALSMAVDREGIVRNIFGDLGLVALGPFPRSMQGIDTTVEQIPHDPDRASSVLDSLGWRTRAGDGIRARGGRPLRFSIMVPTSSAPRVAAAVLLQEQLRRVGVQLDIERLEFVTFVQRMTAHRFDATIALLNFDPTPRGLRQTWGTGSAPPSGFNYGQYDNPRFNALIDSGLATAAPRERSRLLRAATDTIIADAPAIWLYEPRPVAAAHVRLRTPGMRPGAWWAGIPEWHVPADERIARDRIGLQAAPE